MVTLKTDLSNILPWINPLKYSLEANTYGFWIIWRPAVALMAAVTRACRGEFHAQVTSALTREFKQSNMNIIYQMWNCFVKQETAMSFPPE